MHGFIVQHIDHQTLEPVVIGFAENLEVARRMARNSGLVNVPNVGFFECAYVQSGVCLPRGKFTYLDISPTPGME